MTDDIKPADWDLIGRALTRYRLDHADPDDRERLDALALDAFTRAAEVSA